MTVSILSRWTAKQEDVLRIGRRVKSIYEKHGAEMGVGQVFTGPYAGQFLAAARFPDWETCGKAMHAMSTDAEYRAFWPRHIKSANCMAAASLSASISEVTRPTEDGPLRPLFGVEWVSDRR